MFYWLNLLFFNYNQRTVGVDFMVLIGFVLKIEIRSCNRLLTAGPKISKYDGRQRFNLIHLV